MNDEKHTPEEEWEMSVADVPPPKTEISRSGEWQMPEPVFRVSEGDAVKRTGERMIAPAEDAAAENVAAETDSIVQEQPDISEEFHVSDFDDARNFQAEATAKSERGNAKWLFLLGGIFVFFAVVGGILVGAYFLFWKE